MPDDAYREKALDKIDAEESARLNAANFYIFLLLLAWLGLAVQSFPPVKELKALWWPAMGIIFASWTGLSNVGTHDRQVWCVSNRTNPVMPLSLQLMASSAHTR